MRLFVLGTPRSGTTAVGALIGTHPRCLDLGEYYGFYLALHQVPAIMERVPALLKTEFQAHLLESVLLFADRARDEAGAAFWCDQTPLNLWVADKLAEQAADAVYVLMLRHYRGAIQSLRRSYADGYRWAGSQLQDSAALWAGYYEKVRFLPPGQTIAISYEQLCESPLDVVQQIETAVAERCGVDPSGFDRRILAKSHATTSSRNTIARLDGDAAIFAPIPAYDAARWSEAHEASVTPFVESVDADLRSRFPGIYREPRP